MVDYGWLLMRALFFELFMPETLLKSVRDLVATICEMKRVVKMSINQKVKNYGKTERHN
jgi:hypothetical protein